MAAVLQGLFRIYQQLNRKDKALLWTIPILVIMVFVDRIGGLGLTDAQKLVDIFQKAAATLAIVIGGVWTYFKFVRGRTFISNLEPTISGRITRKDGADYLLLTQANVKNIGSSKVNIKHEDTGLIIYRQRTEAEITEARSLEWEPLSTDPVSGDPISIWPMLENQNLLEPGESVGEQRAIKIPEATNFPLRLEFWLASEPEEDWLSLLTGSDEAYWVAEGIVDWTTGEGVSDRDTLEDISGEDTSG